MLVSLLPSQISERWDELEYAIEAALPPIAGEGSDKMNNILESLLASQMICWVSMRDNQVRGVITTKILFDDVTMVRSLLIYSIFAMDHSNDSDWLEGFQTIKKYARSKDCSRIIGYTEFDSVIKKAQIMGAETKYRFVSWEI